MKPAKISLRFYPAKVLILDASKSGVAFAIELLLY